MARISLVEPQNAGPEVKEIYEQTLKGKPGNIQKAVAHRPQVLKSFLAFYPSVGRSLDRGLYEMVYIRVSMLNRCHYWMQHHLASSKRAGLTEKDWKALQDPKSADFGAPAKAALAFAEKLTRMPWEIKDEDINTLKQYFSDEQIVDLDLLVGLANLTNRFTDPLGLELEFAAEKL